MSTEYTLISADSHVNPPPTFWADYLPREFREQAPRLETTHEGEFEVFEGRRTLLSAGLSALSATAGKKPEEYDVSSRRQERRPGGYDPVERLIDQDIEEMQAEVIYGGGPLKTQDAALRLASHSAYNDWIADFCSNEPSRLLGMAYIPVDTLEIAVKETRRTIGRGLRGVVIPHNPPGTEWGDPAWDPLWTTIEELDVPAAIHTGPLMGDLKRRFDTGPHFMTDMVLGKLSLAKPFVEVIIGGVLDRHPDLRVIGVEGQIGWVPFVLEYLDHSYNKHRYWSKYSLKELPSDYARRQVCWTFIEDPVGLRERHAIGIDNILWSSDYPHSETTWPNSKKLTDEWLAAYPEDEKRKIVCDNARQLYHL
jgi:predicted TIM-barrel fold metal-dependent hydrolase